MAAHSKPEWLSATTFDVASMHAHKFCVMFVHSKMGALAEHNIPFLYVESGVHMIVVDRHQTGASITELD